MKRQLIYLLASVAVLATGCTKSESESGTGYGRVAIGCEADLAIDTRAVPSGTHFSLIIMGEGGYRGEWKTVSAFTSQDTIFLEGPYKAVVAYGDPNAEGANKAYYYGEQAYNILRRQTVNVAVNAQVANSQTEVIATKAFLKYFHGAKFTVTTASGNKFEFSPTMENLDANGEPIKRAPIYVKVGTTLSVTGTAKRQSWNGTSEGLEVKFGEQKLASTQPRTCHIFKFDAQNAGSATLEIYLGEEYTETRQLDVELNDAAIEDNE